MTDPLNEQASKVSQPRLILIGMLVTLIAAGIYSFYQQFGEAIVEQIQPDEEIPEALKPDFLIENGRTLQYSNTGSLKYQIDAQSFAHYENAQETVMQSPRVIVYTEGAIPWQATSKAGKITTGSRVIDLWDKVRITQRSTQPTPIRLKTEFLTIDANAEKAMTDKPVIITDSLSTVTSVGLEVQLEEKIIKLHSKVQGQYNLKSR